MSQASTQAALNIPARDTSAKRPGLAGMLVAVLLISSAIDAYFFTGFFSSDDQTYYSTALRYVQEGTFTSLNVGSMRLPMVGWIMLVILICGPHVQAVALSYILFHQLLNVLGYFIVKRLYDARAGLLTAYLLAMFPLLIVYSSMILPDVQLACGYALALLCYLEWRDNLAKRPFRAWLLFFVCGATVGVAYMTKRSRAGSVTFLFRGLADFFRSRSHIFYTGAGRGVRARFFRHSRRRISDALILGGRAGVSAGLGRPSRSSRMSKPPSTAIACNHWSGSGGWASGSMRMSGHSCLRDLYYYLW